MSAGKFFQVLGENAAQHAEKSREQQEVARKGEIDVWRKVLEDPYANEAQRTKAVESLNKLYQIKKGQSPFERFGQFMSMIGGKLQGKRQQAQDGQVPVNPPATGEKPTNLPVNPGQTLQPLNEPKGPDAGMTAGKRNFAEKGLGKISSGLGAAFTGLGGAINRQPKQDLPQMNAADFPSGEQIRQGKAEDITADLKAREPFIEKQIKLRGEEAQKTARERTKNALNSKTKYPGAAITNALPDQTMKGRLVDANNLPIDPNGLYAPIAGEEMGIHMDEDGIPVLTAVRVGSGAAREGSYGQIAIDPKTNKLVEIPIHRETNTPAPPKQGSPRLDESKSGAGKPGASATTAKASLTPLTGDGKRGGASNSSAKNGVRVIGDYVRPQQFNPLQRQATATDEARNSLIGDNPKQPAGLMADLDIFKSPQSQQRIMQYLGFVEKNLAGEGGRVAGMGPAAAIEWYTGLPTTVSNLQQQAQQELAVALNPAEQKFVTDYFRVMGTIGGMRASTGMPASRWSFQTLYNELPTPGKVTNVDDAKRRITNLIQETNVVAKRNPLSTTIDVDQVGKVPEMPAHWKKELQNK